MRSRNCAIPPTSHRVGARDGNEPRGRGGGSIWSDQRGLGLVEIAIVVVVLAIVGAVLYAYMASTTRTLETVQRERPLSEVRLAADRATLAAIRSAIQVYQAQHGRWPPDKETVHTLLSPPPRFQCDGNDYDYDPGSGQAHLRVDDLAGC